MRSPSFKLLFGIGCFVWIAIKAYELYDPAGQMSTIKTVFTYIGMFAFAVLGIDNLSNWWKQHRSKKQQQ